MKIFSATCHMCNDKELFDHVSVLETPQEITVGDGHSITATGKGNTTLDMNLMNGKVKWCQLSCYLWRLCLISLWVYQKLQVQARHLNLNSGFVMLLMKITVYLQQPQSIVTCFISTALDLDKTWPRNIESWNAQTKRRQEEISSTKDLPIWEQKNRKVLWKSNLLMDSTMIQRRYFCEPCIGDK